MENFDKCPNCGTEIKSGFLRKTSISSELQTRLINTFTDNHSEGYCERCGKKLFADAYQAMKDNMEEAKSFVKANIKTVPLVTINAPLNWDYQVTEMVTAQAVIGTGIATEISSSFTDLFGGNSASLNAKLRYGENLCAAQLRTKTLELGANAIIGVDIDYNEVGGEKGMLMVCMAGTAIHLKNPEIISPEHSTNIQQLYDALEKISFIKSFENVASYI
jgi:uncharacterized protein YbjQ (UPF0145 family)